MTHVLTVLSIATDGCRARFLYAASRPRPTFRVCSSTGFVNFSINEDECRDHVNQVHVERDCIIAWHAIREQIIPERSNIDRPRPAIAIETVIINLNRQRHARIQLSRRSHRKRRALCIWLCLCSRHDFCLSLDRLVDSERAAEQLGGPFACFLVRIFSPLIHPSRN